MQWVREREERKKKIWYKYYIHPVGRSGVVASAADTHFHQMNGPISNSMHSERISIVFVCAHFIHTSWHALEILKHSKCALAFSFTFLARNLNICIFASVHFYVARRGKITVCIECWWMKHDSIAKCLHIVKLCIT